MDSWLFERLPILPVTRVLAVATAFPMMAGPGSPRSVRVAVALALAVLLVPAPLGAQGAALSPAATLAALPFEVMVGFAIGYAFSLVFHVLAIAGDFLGQEMGLNAASQIDPVTGRSVPLLARLFEVLGLVVFVETGGMGVLLRTVRDSFTTLPAGALLHPGAIAEGLTDASVRTIAAGIAFALPAGILLMVLTLFTTITARVLPKLHIFDFAYALRMLVAIFLVSLLLPRLVPHLLQFTERVHALTAGFLLPR